MDQQTVINLVGGAILLVSGWFLRELWDAVKDLRKDLHNLQVNSVPRSEFTENIRHIEEICRQIFEKIDSIRKDMR